MDLGKMTKLYTYVTIQYHVLVEIDLENYLVIV